MQHKQKISELHIAQTCSMIYFSVSNSHGQDPDQGMGYFQNPKTSSHAPSQPAVCLTSLHTDAFYRREWTHAVCVCVSSSSVLWLWNFPHVVCEALVCPLWFLCCVLLHENTLLYSLFHCEPFGHLTVKGYDNWNYYSQSCVYLSVDISTHFCLCTQEWTCWVTGYL